MRLDSRAIGDRVPHMMAKGDLRLTLLNCGVCQTIGHFPIFRISLAGGRRTFACAPCATNQQEGIRR